MTTHELIERLNASVAALCGRGSVLPPRIQDAVNAMDEAAQALSTLTDEVARLREAAEIGLQYAIDAANEWGKKDAVFDNMMSDICRIEDTLTKGEGRDDG